MVSTRDFDSRSLGSNPDAPAILERLMKRYEIWFHANLDKIYEELDKMTAIIRAIDRANMTGTNGQRKSIVVVGRAKRTTIIKIWSALKANGFKVQELKGL